jgi:hypothetical protein
MEGIFSCRWLAWAGREFPFHLKSYFTLRRFSSRVVPSEYRRDEYIALDKNRLRWEASGNEVEGRRMREENLIRDRGGDIAPFMVFRL